MDAKKEQWILPSDGRLQYMGRIDFEDPDAPIFVYVCSSVRICFRGSSIRCRVTNIHSYYENSVGVILDGVQQKVLLPDSGTCELLLGENLDGGDHELILFKRMDACHYLTFLGFLLPQDAKVLPSPNRPKRRMEFYGDSVTAGEVCEAVDYCGKADPEHNGVYSNGWYSYSWLTARRLNAEIHNIAQGGIALLRGTGYFCDPELYGLEDTYDKIEYNPYIQPMKPWDFSCYRPHVVVVAVGQNDNHPEDYMAQGIENPQAKNWREHYCSFVRNLRQLYPKATIILATTILNHHENWDNAIDAVCRELSDEKVHHFLYSNNGCGTPGHIRISEAEKMSEELSAFIASLGEEIWEDER